ncbi:MAG: hypothetical protein HF973_07260 [Chloroflexi bacterium]|nr:hypothetical protein [Chloroflexota bacterium]
MSDLLHQPGFLGTPANFGADMTLAAMVLFAILLTIGVILAVKGKYGTHRWMQTTAVALNIIIVLWLMLLPYRDFIAPGIPQDLNQPFYWITTLHAFVGFFAFFLGIFIVLRANGLMIKQLKFSDYKRWMRLSYALYMITVLLGLAVYYVWFIGNPNPPVYG